MSAPSYHRGPDKHLMYVTSGHGNSYVTLECIPAGCAAASPELGHDLLTLLVIVHETSP